MTEITFYHLTESTLEKALPGLVERSVARDWKVVIQAGSQERIEVIDTLLWTFRDDSFLPHSAAKDATQANQPIWLTSDEENPNSAHIRFLVDGAHIDDPSGYERVVYMFDGHNNASVEHARERWKFHKDAEQGDLTYWQQNANGGWEKKA